MNTANNELNSVHCCQDNLNSHMRNFYYLC